MSVHKNVIIIRLKGTFLFVDSVHTAEAANSGLFPSWSWPLVVGTASSSCPGAGQVKVCALSIIICVDTASA